MTVKLSHFPVQSHPVGRPRVLILHPPVTVARDFVDYPYFTDLGAVQLAAVLREQSLAEITLIDAFALPGSDVVWRRDGRAHLGAPIEEIQTIVRARVETRGSYELVVVAYTPFHRPPVRDDVLGKLLSELRRLSPHASIVLADCYQSGQHYIEVDGNDVLTSYPEANAWVKYEAEVTVPALLHTLVETGRRPNGTLHGIAPPDLDALPLPAWDLTDLAAHDRFRQRVISNLGRRTWAFPIDGRTLPLVTSRGCPFACVHCSSNPGRPPGAPKTQRRYSPERLRRYLRTLVYNHHATRLAVLDELINVNERHWDTFLNEVSALGIRFEIPNGLRADYLHRSHFEKMRGKVTTVSISAESGVQRVVTDIVRKQLDLRSIVRAAEDAHATGVPVMIHYIIGLPGERPEDINATLAFAMDLYQRFGATPAVQYATPLPGTPLARGRKLPVVNDWGPRFQTAPTPMEGSVPADILEKFKLSFEQRLRASQGPRKLILNVTYACNNHCTFCAVGNRTPLHGHPSRQREFLESYRAQGVTMVDFDGGEPTLDPALVPLIRYARALGYQRITVTTNGRLCYYEDFARKLVRSGLTTLLFSVHGPDATTHAQQVGVPEAFEQTIAGIRNCVRHAPADVELGMNVTLTKSNHDKLDAMAQLAWDLGLRWMNVQFLTPFGRATRWIAPDTTQAANIAMRVIDRWKDRMKFQVINLPFCFMPGYEQYLLGDLFKLERHMIFVNNEDVNLAEYLAARRVRKPQCDPCPYAIMCAGFYELDSVPEPPWSIRPEDLLRTHASKHRH